MKNTNDTNFINMKEYFAEQLQTNPPKLFYLEMGSLTDTSVSLKMYSIDSSEIETLADKYSYKEHRGIFPIFEKIKL
jgi:hypothetical protein